MPNYQYECKNCHNKFEIMQAISKRHESICPKCGNSDNALFIGTGCGFILRGEGFYESTKKDKELYQPIKKAVE